MDIGKVGGDDTGETHDARQLFEQQQQNKLAEECRRLRRLQAFRARNACALISLPPPSCGQDAWRVEHAAATPSDDLQQEQKHDVNNLEDERTNPTITYRLCHLTCSMTPTVSVHELNHTRPGHPSDIPPSLDARALRKAGVEDMLTRLIIPNISPTSIRCADHHRPSMASAKEQGRDASLSLAHQRAGLSMMVDSVAGNCSSRSESPSTRYGISCSSSASTGNTGMLSPS